MDYIGELEFVNAQPESLRQLGIDPNDIGNLPRSEAKFLIDDQNTQFGGCDLRVRGESVSQIVLRIRAIPPRVDPALKDGELASEAPQKRVGPRARLSDWISGEEIRITLSELLDGPIERKVGERSRVVLDRSPGDRFLLKPSEAQDWILEPGESLSTEVIPNAAPWRDQLAQFEWSLIRVSDGSKLMQQSSPIELDANGMGTPLSIEIPSVPREEGVYELHCKLEPKRLLPGIVFPHPNVHRKIQFVVRSASSIRSNDDGMDNYATIQWTKLKSSIDNREPLSERESRWKQWTTSLPRLRSSNVDRNPPSESIELKPRETIRVPVELPRLAEGYALRAAIEKPFKGLAVRVLESSSSRAQELDTELARYHWKPSSVEIAKLHVAPNSSESDPHERSASGESRDVSVRDGYFFPIQRTIWLELHNTSEDTPVSVSRIEVFRTRSQVKNQRFVQSPKVIEYLTADDWRRLLYRGRKQKPGQLYDTWDSMEAAFDAWLVSCKWRGIDTVSLPVLSNGSSLYPTECIASVPRLETGRFDSEGLDPNEKDVVQWIYHMCHSRGILFIPSFEWDMPLESFFDPSSISEKELQHTNTLGSSKHDRWNPLQVSVQQRMMAILLEFEHRYRSTPGYLGYALKIDPKSSLHIQGSMENLSDLIVDRLAGHLQGNLPKDPLQRRQAIQKLASGSFDAWQRQQVYDALENMHRDIYCIFYPKSLSLHGLKVGTTPAISILPESKSIARDWTGKMWTDGTSQIAIETKLDRTGFGEWNGIANPLMQTPWSNELEPVARTDRQRSIDRIRVWQEFPKGNPPRAVILNAGPTDTRVLIRWTESPGNVKLADTKTTDRDWQFDPNDSIAAITIPPYSLRSLQWEAIDVRLHSWSSDENRSMQWIESALGAIEQNVTRLSQPRPNESLLSNADFEANEDSFASDQIKGWSTSINPNAPIRTSNLTALSGNQSLVFSFQSNDASGWIQSDPFLLVGDRLLASIHYSTSNACRGFLSLWVWNPSMDRFELISKRECIPGKTDPRNPGWQRWEFDFSSELQNPNRAFRGEQYRLQLELSGEGEVYLDRVELSTDYLSDRERLDLRNSLFVSRRSLGEGIADPALRLIESAWGFLALAPSNDSSGWNATSKPIKTQGDTQSSALRNGMNPAKEVAPKDNPTGDKPPADRGANRKWRGFWNR